MKQKQCCLLVAIFFVTATLKAVISSVQFRSSVVSDSSRPHGLQHSRPPCLSPTPGVYSNSCPLSRWCNPTISSSVTPPCPPDLNLSQHHICMCVCVCVCKGGARGPGPPGGREAPTWHIHVEVESLWVRAWSPMEPLDCDLWGTVKSPSQVLSWCWPCAGQCHWGRTPDDPGLVFCPYIEGVGPWAGQSGWTVREPGKCLGDPMSISGG